MPREAKVASLILHASGVNECEPKVIQQLLEFMYRKWRRGAPHRDGWCGAQLKTSIGYVCEVLQESLVYSEHAGRTDVEIEDVRMAIKSQLRRSFIQPPSREVSRAPTVRRWGSF